MPENTKPLPPTCCSQAPMITLKEHRALFDKIFHLLLHALNFKMYKKYIQYKPLLDERHHHNEEALHMLDLFELEYHN